MKKKIIADAKNKKQVKTVTKKKSPSGKFLLSKENERTKYKPELKDAISLKKFTVKPLKKEDAERYRSMVENIADGYFEVDLAGNFTFFNNAVCRVLGYSPKELMGRNNRFYTDKENAKKVFEAFNKVYKTRKPLKRFEWGITRKDGVKRYIEGSISLRKDSSGKPIGFLGITNDITERKLAEEALSKSEERFKAQYQGSPLSTFTWQKIGKDFVLKEINAAALMATGGRAKKFINKTANKMYHNRQDVLRDIQKCFEEKIVLKKELLSEHFMPGRHIVATYTFVPNALVMVHIEDITERKRILEALQESENKYRELVENVSEVIFSVNIQGCITYVSPAVEHLTGYSIKDVIGTAISNHIIPEDLPNVLDSINRILASGQEEAIEYRIKIKNGEIRYVVSSTNVILKDGQPAGLTGIITDITPRKQAEKALKEAELKFRTIFDSASDGILLADSSSKKFIAANEQTLLMLGYTKEEILKLKVSDIHPQESLPYVIDQFEKLARKEIAIVHDIPVMRKDKTVFFADVNSSSIILDGKECLLGMFRDVTEHRQAEEALSVSERRYRRLFESAKDGILILDSNTGIIIDINPFLIELLGYSLEQLIGKAVWELGSFKDIIPNKNKFLELQRHGYIRYEDLPLETIDGRLINVEVVSNVYAVNHTKVIQCNIRDITERKHAELALREAKNYAENLIQTANVMVVVLDAEGNVSLLNEAGEMITGYKANEIIGRKWFDLIVPMERFPYVWNEFEKLKSAGSIIDNLENPILTKSGEERIISWKNSTLTISGKFLGTLSFGMDITDRRRADEKLKLEEQRFRSLTESSSDIILLMNTKGAVTYINPAIENILGYKPEERIGANGLELVHPDDLQSMLNKFNILATTAKYSVLQAETRLRHKDGSWRIFETTGNNIIKDNAVEAVIVRQHDITKRKKVEEELLFINKAVEDSSDAIGISDPQGHHLYQNKAFCDLFEYSTAEELEAAGGGLVVFANKDTASEVFDAIMSGRSWHGEIDMISKSGRIFPVSIRADAIKDEAGKIIGLIGIHTDITERKRVEGALKRSEEDFRSLFEQSLDGILIIDQSGIIMANHAFSVMSGLPIEKIIGKNPLDFIHPDDREIATQRMAQLNTGQQISDGYFYRGLRTDGSLFWVDLRSQLVEWKGKRVFQTIVRDINERRQAEEALRANEEKYRGIFDESITAIYVFDTKKSFINSNQAGLDLLGYSREELMHMSIPDVDADPLAVLPAHQELFDGGRLINYEHKLRRKDGKIITVLNNSRPLTDANGNMIGMLSTLIDITERKKVEKKLKESEELFKNLFLFHAAVKLIIDPDTGSIMDANEAAVRYYGWSHEQITHMKIQDINTCPSEEVKVAMEDVKARKRASFEFRHRRADGSVRDVEVFSTNIKVQGKDIFHTIVHDITERKGAEEKLKQSQLLNEAIISSVPGLLYLFDNTGHIIQWNKQAEKITGYSFEEIKAKYIFDWFGDFEPDKSNIKNGINEVMTKGYSSTEAHLITKDGNRIPWFFTGVKLNIAGKDHLLGIGIDITERKKAEEELERYHQHLEELVRERTTNLEASNKELEAFSYSASHDLRAPLRSIDGFSQALLEDCWDKLDIQGKDYLIRIKAASKRMADLIEDMLQLSRITRMEMNIEKVDLTRIARSVIDELQKSQPRRNVEIRIAEGLEDTADLRLMRIVLDNLLSNAWKFTERQAKAKVEFGLWKMEDTRKVYFIRDNGAGFDMAYADKLFAPFQRLHADDEFPGTGIGLATVRRIINRHGGRIRAEGKIDKGATFYFSINEK